LNDTAVVILNYNGLGLLRKFLPSVLRFSGDASVIVADNCSTDGSLEMLSSEFKSVKVIAMDRNRGFCGGYNHALKEIDARYFVLLNSDVEVTDGWLQPLREKMSADPQVAAVQPAIMSYQEKDHFEYAGAAGGFIDELGYPFCRGRIFDHLEKNNGQYDTTRDIFWASGACLAIRSELYHRMGGLDEDFFAHMEEIDLCWKLHRAGYRVACVGQSKIYHVGGGTLAKSNPRKTYFNFRNGLSLIFKHFSPAEIWWKFPMRIILDWVAAISFLFAGSGAHSAAVLRAHFHFFNHISKDWKKRRMLRQTLPGFRREQVLHGSVVVQYFLAGKRTFDRLGI